ncbi:efflux RND transporter periplasmic adaptor subunit [Variovorax dokdonensis]|uniref:Efflux RND transporter periplasmic adaptor subunit n=1 Tax=Variovorax dokdonensis TaxID=344883 RepID=A0ABT7NEV7_9BURK|nr:efflux RND transporter periplasmic adaptor subunit [Variovorax dokdonensis]MDM0046485.1 efflux RND transporter periplasmic adaptor subunit [Variovorax dokdonensis]
MPQTPDAPPAAPIDSNAARGGRRRRGWGTVVALLLMAALVGGSWYLIKHSSSSPGGFGGRGGPGGPGGFGGAPLVTVGDALVKRMQLPITLDALGTVTPLATVTLKPQVGGVLTEVLFTEGQTVKKGQLLARIDPRPYEQALAQAQGTLQRDEAQLQAARVTLQRYRTLLGQDSIARQEVDTQAALVGQLEGTILTDKANVATARLNLDFTRLTSPVDGRIGLRTVDPGNTVAANASTGIAVITQMNPIDVQFSVPQDQVPAIQRQSGAGAAMQVVAMDRNRSETLDTGRFSTLDNVVDVSTGTVKAKARFDNTASVLFPNQFVNVRMTLRVVDALVVPVTAVRNGPKGPYVYVIGDDRKAQMRSIERGETTVEWVQIRNGLKEGERVVTEGGDRLDDGTRVQLQGEAAAPGGAAGAKRPGGAPGSAPAPVAKTDARPAGADGTQAKRAIDPPNAQQRQRILDSARGDTEKLAERKAFLEAIDKGDPQALERWRELSQRRRRQPAPE